MDRREFVKRAGVGSVGLGALAASPVALAGRPGFPKGGGHQHFTLVALSRAAPVGDGIDHMMILEGSGTFKASPGHADGGGNFIHFDFAAPGTSPIASGKWEVTDFLSYSTPVGDYGRIRASIVTVRVELQPDAGGSLAGTLLVACNVGFVPLLTGQPEGFKLSVDGSLDFNAPFLGLTHIGIPEGESSA
ncbi:MAG TPA: hypothetical protein VM198_12375 [Longimicrobiales bacterium]|nr:hypothetical protein [Longimicrobiales bacterium]